MSPIINARIVGPGRTLRDPLIEILKVDFLQSNRAAIGCLFRDKMPYKKWKRDPHVLAIGRAFHSAFGYSARTNVIDVVFHMRKVCLKHGIKPL